MKLDIRARNRCHRRRRFACRTLLKAFPPRRTNMHGVAWPEMALPRRVIGHDDYAENFASLRCTLLYRSYIHMLLEHRCDGTPFKLRSIIRPAGLASLDCTLFCMPRIATINHKRRQLPAKDGILLKLMTPIPH